MRNVFPFRRGDYIRIMADINAIPAGIYRLVAFDSESFLFSIGERVLIEIGSEAAGCFQKVPRREGRKRHLTFPQFETKYWELMKMHSRASSTGVRTGCCFMGEPNRPDELVVH